MNRAKKNLWRGLFGAAVVILAVGVAAPYVHADQFGERIRQALEHSLNRRVEIVGPVRFNLFTGPGFTVSEVIIHEDPAFGREPFAYVSRLEASVRLWSLLRGRLEFSTLRLVEPSVNLVKSPAGPWNFQPLWERAFGGSRAQGSLLPEIEVRSGRLNFKTGGTKSVYYFSDADVDVSPSTDGREVLAIGFSGEPARTDRSAQGFGRLAGSGRWVFSQTAESRVELNLRLERSAIAEVMTLLEGRSVGWDGFVVSRARMAGPVSHIDVSGSLQLEDIHRWDLMPSRGGKLSLSYKGEWDLSAQKLLLETLPPEGGALPVSVRLRVSEYLFRPRWGVALTLDQLRLESVPALARQLELSLSEDFVARGKLSGTIGYYSPGEIQGEITVQDGSLGDPESPVIRFAEARLLVDNERIRLDPADIALRNNQAARVEASYFTEAGVYDMRISTKSLAVEEFQAAWHQLTGATIVPVLEACHQGVWKGTARYTREGDSPGNWLAEFDLERARIPLPGFSEPLAVRSAAVKVQGRRVEVKRIDAEVGTVKVEGEYWQEAEASRPGHFRLLVPELDAMELERILLPTLQRRRGFLARTLRLRPAPVPAWLRSRHAEGTLQIGTLLAPGGKLSELHTKIYWNGARVELREFQSRLDGALVTGRISADLRHGEPAYGASVRVQRLPWRGGTIDATGRFETAGTGAELPLNVRSDGSFQGHSILVGAETEWRAAKGCYELLVVRGVPRLLLTSIEVDTGVETYYGYGSSSPEGRLQVELYNGPKEMKMAGTLMPLQLETMGLR